MSNVLMDWLKKFTQQVIVGCGRPVCTHPYCASNPLCEKYEQNSAIALGIKIAKEDMKLFKFCETPPPPFFNEEKLHILLEDYENTKNEVPLIHEIGKIFSNISSLNLSFLKKGKEGIADNDKSGVNFDLLNKTYEQFLNIERISSTISKLFDNLLGPSIRRHYLTINSVDQLRFYIILLHYPSLQNPDLHRNFLFPLCYSIGHLSVSFKDTLVNWITGMKADTFRNIVYATQTLIARYLLENFDVNGCDRVQSGVLFLELLYKANQRMKFLKYDDFYNGVLNQFVEECEQDLIPQFYQDWKIPQRPGPMPFSVCNYPFILNPLTKSQLLLFDSHEQMLRKREEALQLMIQQGRFNTPYLVLQIQREHLIATTLQQIEHILEDNKDDLKKKLIVKFVGEEGVDQGGPQKEFFQLIIKQLFDIKYGMFIELQETKNYWFSHSSMEIDEFRLIGVLLGLAIYNGVILDIRFPFIIYKKLMDQPLTFEDLQDVFPSIYKGLKEINSFEGNIEETYNLNFQIPVESFGEKIMRDLIENGDQILVTQENKLQYIELYTNWLLEKSVEDQFRAFVDGFKCVCDGLFFELFQVEEVELLICGETKLDFEELEEYTSYDNGYTQDDQVIKDFWEVVHSLSMENKKKFLSFATGSDRSPIGGLKNLHLVITRHGEDSDRLPQSHTCFNVLLLPQYGSKEKVRDRLLTAIGNSEGFGLL